MPTLHFKGKPLVQNHHLVVPFSELEAVKSRGLSKAPSLHDNLIVEGDNLKALKALLPAFHGKVKCIYIDPPYNTGNEGWIYNDKVNSPMMRDWLGRTVDRDDLTRHDKWCCMMLPRLKLLRELLTDDGAIFVSIDDNEVHHLRALMDEVFGEENFVATVIWEKVYSPKSSAKYFSENHDFIVVYARRKEALVIDLLPRTEAANARYSNPDKDSRGDWKASDLSARNPYSKGIYSITCPGGRVIKRPPEGRYWAVAEEKFWRLNEDNRIWWGEDKNQVPALKRFLTEVKQGLVPETIWTYDEVGHTQAAKKTLLDIFNDKFPDFVSPKPVALLSRIIQTSTAPDSIILDSFAGSATTAHAVLALNKEDGGNRRFILCQMPYETKEQEEKKENICESITAERVRRVIQGVPKAKDEALRAGLGGTFSYFRLGKELRKQAILDGRDLPSYEALAGYVFFTATGEEFQPKKMKPPFIGTSRDRDVFLVYEQDMEKLKDMALNLELARTIVKRSDRKKLVFAPTKYLDQDYLDRLGIEFCQLPFEIYQRAQK
jgi:adenine-specific DNA-methyltransferase